MIGARDMAFPRLNAFGFWMFLFGGILLYFSYIAGEGLAGHGSAPDVGWFAYAPLTERAFSRARVMQLTTAFGLPSCQSTQSLTSSAVAES